MIITSKFLGPIDIEENQVIHFPEGIPAFEEHREFVVLPMDEKSSIYYLQDVNDVALCLIMADPFAFFPDYLVELKDEQLQKLDAEEKEDSVVVFTILTIPEDFKQASANLMAPVVINLKNKKGIQFIPAKSDYTIRHPLFKQEQASVAKER